MVLELEPKLCSHRRDCRSRIDLTHRKTDCVLGGSLRNEDNVYAF